MNKAADFEFAKKGKTDSSNIFYSKYIPQKGIKYNLALVFQKNADNTTTFIFYVNGEEISTANNLEFAEFTCEPDSTIQLGNDAENNPLVGSFKYLFLFKTALSLEDINVFMSNVSDRIIMPDPSANPSGVVTTDGRPCITDPTDAPVPGEPGSPPGPN